MHPTLVLTRVTPDKFTLSNARRFYLLVLVLEYCLTVSIKMGLTNLSANVSY